MILNLSSLSLTMHIHILRIALDWCIRIRVRLVDCLTIYALFYFGT